MKLSRVCKISMGRMLGLCGLFMAAAAVMHSHMAFAEPFVVVRGQTLIDGQVEGVYLLPPPQARVVSGVALLNAATRVDISVDDLLAYDVETGVIVDATTSSFDFSDFARNSCFAEIFLPSTMLFVPFDEVSQGQSLEEVLETGGALAYFSEVPVAPCVSAEPTKATKPPKPPKTLTIFKATFSTDAIDASPVTPDVGAWLSISTGGGTILVRSGLGNLTDKPVELARAGSGQLAIVGSVAGTPPGSGVFIARWRALVHSGQIGGVVGVLSDDGRLIASVAHAGVDQLLIYNNSGVPGTGVSWATDVSQLFDVTIDLDNRLTTLRIDGVVVEDSVPFADPLAANISRIVLTMGSMLVLSFAVDDVEIFTLLP